MVELGGGTKRIIITLECQENLLFEETIKVGVISDIHFFSSQAPPSHVIFGLEPTLRGDEVWGFIGNNLCIDKLQVGGLDLGLSPS
jgi:hypothetical protein